MKGFNVGDTIKTINGSYLYLGEFPCNFSYKVLPDENKIVVSKNKDNNMFYAYQYVGETNLHIKSGWIGLFQGELSGEFLCHESLAFDPSTTIWLYFDNHFLDFSKHNRVRLAIDSLISKHQCSNKYDSLDCIVENMKQELQDRKFLIGKWEIIVE